MKEDVKTNATPIVVGVVLAMVAGFWLYQQLPVPQTADVTVPDTVPDTGPDTGPDVAETAQVLPVEAATPAPAPTVVVEAPAPVTLPAAPQFDTFRVEPDGAMVIAGRAGPGQLVDVILAGRAIDRVTADGSGSFVALPMAGPSDQPRRLSLLADPDGDAIPSDTSFIVAPIAAPVVVAEVPAPVDAPALDDAAEAPPPPVATTQPAPAPTVLQADADGVRVVQDGPQDNVALDAITYDPDGKVQLSGRAIGDGSVQVYIDNAPLTTSQVTQGGDWQIALPEIETGVYTLRIDEVDADGDVVSRLETPFKREEPAEVAAVLAEETAVDGFEVAVKTVQPGATLWAIAEENLGDGILYIEVFAANRDLIRDPNLIYPGQIFRIPEITE